MLLRNPKPSPLVSCRSRLSFVEQHTFIRFFTLFIKFFLNSDARKQWMQKIDLLRKLIIQLKDDENNRELSK